jgi:hypothetical protein
VLLPVCSCCCAQECVQGARFRSCSSWCRPHQKVPPHVLLPCVAVAALVVLQLLHSAALDSCWSTSVRCARKPVHHAQAAWHGCTTGNTVALADLDLAHHSLLAAGVPAVCVRAACTAAGPKHSLNRAMPTAGRCEADACFHAARSLPLAPAGSSHLDMLRVKM